MPGYYSGFLMTSEIDAVQRLKFEKINANISHFGDPYLSRNQLNCFIGKGPKIFMISGTFLKPYGQRKLEFSWRRQALSFKGTIL